ncbi:hypothetical protein Tco_0519356 [Tanacetum coccineum]
MGSITTWDTMVEKFIMKFHHLFYHNDDEDIEEEEDPNKTNNAPEIFMIEGNLFDFETPLYEAFNEFNCLLKIYIDLFTYDEYEQELNNDEAKGTDEPWSEKGVPYRYNVITYANHTASRMEKLSGPRATLTLMDSVMVENYQEWFELEA